MPATGCAAMHGGAERRVSLPGPLPPGPLSLARKAAEDVLARIGSDGLRRPLPRTPPLVVARNLDPGARMRSR